MTLRCNHGPVLSGIDRDPPGEPTPGFRADAVLLRHVLDDEAGALHQGNGVPGEVAAISQPTLQGLEPALPCLHTRIGGKAMFEEVEPAPGTKHTPHLGKRGVGIGNRAQGEGAQSVVTAVIGEGNRLAVESDPLDGDCCPPP